MSAVATLGQLASKPFLEHGNDGRELEAFYDRDDELILLDESFERYHSALLDGLESGQLRAARPFSESESGWRAEGWLKRAILLGFRALPTVAVEGWPGAFDRAAYPPRRFAAHDQVRLVPGGSAVRRGAHVAAGVVVMPPAYVNVGAFIGPGTMIDSHVLVGSCAQIGGDVHLSAGAQIGGVLEPPGSLPVIIEDGAFIGGQCGVYEGLIVGRGAVLAPGVQLTASTEIFDLPNGKIWRGRVPEDAVVVCGSRPASGDFASRRGLQIYAPMIVKYRDRGTDAATALEEALR